MIIPISTVELISIRYTSVAVNPPSPRAPASHINILAGLILYRKNARRHHTTIAMSVVAKNCPATKVIIPKAISTNNINHHTRPSSPSVILMALVIEIVRKNVMIG